ncbi:voltage-dependent T-type calcium channel subunit alpha-1H isoform X2 [Esox lucius]|uniref:Voltage-dependent T-type calcium channel subunit alpha n=1 Tax=Esox lucius TaxID=8010 RepID=A0A6Q2YWF2_ESOLU|nr:voltage-dependent T-type calcium channel subunit alpha-1H isoform X2 [Esox lucius]
MTDSEGREPEEEEEEEEREEEDGVSVPIGGEKEECRGETSGDRKEEELPYPALSSVVLFRLSQTTPPRCWCLKAVCHPWFERVSMLAILLNCVTLGMFQPCDDVRCLSHRCSFLQALDDGIFAFFALEMLVKMVALGVLGQKGYLGDTWNRLDFFIVIVGMLEYSLDGHNVSLSAIRTVRVLRPLRAINRVPSMRILVTLLLDTLPMLGNVLALCFFVFFIFGIVGVQLWAGLLRNRCFMGDDFRTVYNVSFLTAYYRPEETEDFPFICSTNRENGMLRCSDVPRRRVGRSWCMLGVEGEGLAEGPGLADGPIGRGCVNWHQYYNVCRAGELNPHKGAINFDNIGYAWIAIFQVITLEGWVDIMYYVMDAHSFYNFIYFIFLIIVGSFFMLNLCLVVIATQFSETKQRENALMKSEQRARYLSNASTLASYQEPGSCYEEMLRYIGHLYRKLSRRVSRAVTVCSQNMAPRFCPCRTQTAKGEVNGLASRHSGHAHDVFHLHHHHHHHHHHHCPPPHTLSDCGGVSNGRGGRGRGLNYPSIYSHDLYNLPLTPYTGHMTPRGKGHTITPEIPRKLPQPVSEQGVCDSSLTLPLSGSEYPCPYCLRDDGLSDSDSELPDSERGNQRDGKPNSRHRNQSPPRGNSPLHIDGRAPGPIGGLVGWGWAELQSRLDQVVTSRYFNRGIMMAILINTLSMGIEFHQQPQELTDILEISNLVFTSMFVLEMLLKLLAFGLFGYIKNPYNSFDSVIVIISVWEIIGQADGGLSVLRTFRLLRVLKLVRFMPALRRQLVVLMKTMDNVATFCMLLMLFIFIFSILGMHLFGCKFGLKLANGDTLPDRKNFDSLLWAIVTVFQILTQEDWNTVLYNGMASTTPFASLYFVALMTFGNYVLFNLLVAILVEGFQAEGDANRSEADDEKLSTSEEEKMRELYTAELKVQAMMLTPNGLLNPRASMPFSPTQSPMQPPEQPSPWQPPPLIMHTIATPTTYNSQSRRCSAISTETSNALDPRSPSPWESRRSSWSSIGRGRGLQQRRSQSSEHCNGTACHTPDGSTLCYYSDQEEEEEEDDEDAEESVCVQVKLILEPFKPQWCRDHEDCSLYVFSPHNRFRRCCLRVIAHKMFDHIILLFIFLNCITIALERPDIQPYSTERVFLSVSNHIFTVIFVAEMTIKVVAQGLYVGEGVYLKSSWNVLDGMLVFVSLLDIVVSIASASNNRILGILRVLRILRTLRPLRVISRAPGLKLVVETLITSLRPIGNIVLICCAFFIVFGILGVQLFKGKFYHCEGMDLRNVTNRTDCLQAGYRWTRRKYNFDNLGQALMSLFVLSSKDGWVSIMYDGLDAVGVDQQPVRNHNPWMLLFFISFLLIVSFFVLNMFVGVVVENFHKCRQDQEEEEARAREEKRAKRAEKRRRKAQERPYYADYSPVRLNIHTLCTSHYLDLFITIIIATNVLTMSMEHYNQSQYLEEGLKYCNYVFTLVFVIETTLKLVAFGLRRFFKERWNQLDLAIVLLSIMGITLEEIDLNASLPINPTIIRIMRVLRIARVLKLLKMATGMRALLDTVVQALPQVGNLGLLFMLLFFIYAALGVELFGKLECSEENPCEGLSRHATFQNFGMAFLTLFRVSTGDNWNGIMKDTLRECRSDDRSCFTYLPLVSPLYFVTFVLTAQFVLVNVVVAVLMKHLEESNKEAQEEAEEEAKEEEARQEEARQEEARQEEARQDASRRFSAISTDGAGLRPSPGQVEEEEGCHDNLKTVFRPSLSRMMSLPSDSYMLRPLRPLGHAPYPPIGHDTYGVHGYSGSISSNGSSGAGSLLQVPGALPSGSRASLVSRGSSCRPTVRLSPAHSIDRHSPSRGRHTTRRPSHDNSKERRASYFSSSSHSMDSRHTPYIHSPSHSIDRHSYYMHSPAHRMDKHTSYINSPSHSMDSGHRLSLSSSKSRPSPHLDRRSSCRLSPTHSMDRHTLSRPKSSLSVSRQLRRQEAVCPDSEDLCCSSSDELRGRSVDITHLTVPSMHFSPIPSLPPGGNTHLDVPQSSSPPCTARGRTPSPHTLPHSHTVHTLRHSHTQRVISTKGHSRSHSDSGPHQPIRPENSSSWHPPCPETTTSQPTSAQPPQSPQRTRSTDATELQNTDSTRLQNSDGTRLQSTDSTRLPSTDSTRLQSTDSTRLQSTDSIRLKNTDSTRLQSTDSTRLPSTDSTRLQSTDSTRLQSADSTRLQNSDSTRLQNTDSTRLQNTDSARLCTAQRPGAVFPISSPSTPQRPYMSPNTSTQTSPLLDDEDDEVSHITSYTHTPEHRRFVSSSTHTPEHTTQVSSPTHTPGSAQPYRSLNTCLSLDEDQRVSPVRKRNKKQRMSPPCISIAPPSEAHVPTATQLMDSSMQLRRRTPSFDSTSQRDSLDTELPETRLSVPFLQLDTSSISIAVDSVQSGCLLLTGRESTLEGEGREEGGARNPQSLLGLTPNPLRRRSLVRMLSTRDVDGEDPEP